MLIIVCYIVVPLKCIRIFLSCGEWIHNIEAQRIIQNDCIEITICVATMLIETHRRLVLRYYNREAKTIVKNVVVLFYIKVHTGWVYPLIDDDIPILNACFWLSFASFRIRVHIAVHPSPFFYKPVGSSLNVAKYFQIHLRESSEAKW